MVSRISVLALTAFVVATAAQADVSTDPSRAPSGAYTVEPRHTQVLFAIPHFGITDFYGRFEKISGTLNFNASAPEKSAVDVTIQMDSLNTPNATLNKELVATDVFNTVQFPTATFKSTQVVKTGPTTGKITGDLTLHGVTKPETLDVTFGGGTADPMSGGHDIGFHGTLTIKRSDFGITGMAWNSLVGDDVKLIIEALFVQQKK
ncbi:MAG TPA: YceI family protein [Rhizomicrobium sp.]|jgi:polyisoprenoid-binding protein YceI